jgi:hypothetical protein
MTRTTEQAGKHNETRKVGLEALPRPNTYFGTNIHELPPQAFIPLIQVLVFSGQGNDGTLQFFNHGFLAFPRFSRTDSILFQSFLPLADFDIFGIIGVVLSIILFTVTMHHHEMIHGGRRWVAFGIVATRHVDAVSRQAGSKSQCARFYPTCRPPRSKYKPFLIDGFNVRTVCVDSTRQQSFNAHAMISLRLAYPSWHEVFLQTR